MTAPLDPLPPFSEIFARRPDGRGRPVPPVILEPCRECGAPRRSHDDANRGYCRTCYRRWADNGYPVEGPPAPRYRGPSDPLVFAEFARRYRTSETTALARDLGVSRRTLQRWKKKVEVAATVGEEGKSTDEPNRRYAYSGRA